MNDNYIKITDTKKKQIILLYIFWRFHNICEKYNLIYNSFGGTMIGIIRHKGFIPWDDDIDVTMPRADYEKFIDIVRKNYNSEFVVHVFPDKNYIYPYAKFGLVGSIQIENAVKDKFNKLSINIDIFPVDGYPLDESEIDEYNSYENNIIMCTYKRPFLRLLLNPFLAFQTIMSRFHGYKYYVKKQISLFSRNKINCGDYVICQGAGWGRKGKLKKELYFDRFLYDFENIKVWGIKDYDSQMRMLYGDYMHLPPKEKRVSPHDDTVYIEKKMYKKIINMVENYNK